MHSVKPCSELLYLYWGVVTVLHFEIRHGKFQRGNIPALIKCPNQEPLLEFYDKRLFEKAKNDG